LPPFVSAPGADRSIGEHCYVVSSASLNCDDAAQPRDLGGNGMGHAFGGIARPVPQLAGEVFPPGPNGPVVAKSHCVGGRGGDLHDVTQSEDANGVDFCVASTVPQLAGVVVAP